MSTSSQVTISTTPMSIAQRNLTDTLTSLAKEITVTYRKEAKSRSQSLDDRDEVIKLAETLETSLLRGLPEVARQLTQRLVAKYKREHRESRTPENDIWVRLAAASQTLTATVEGVDTWGFPEVVIAVDVDGKSRAGTEVETSIGPVSWDISAAVDLEAQPKFDGTWEVKIKSSTLGWD